MQGGYAFKSVDFKDSGIPVLKITNVQDRKIELNNLSYVDKNIVTGLEKFFIKSGDILISMTGNGPQSNTALVGRTARYTGTDNSYLLNQRVGRFLVNEELVRKRYLYYLISRPEINRAFACRSTGSANQANINASTIENFEIVLPNINEQDKILTILGDIDDKIELNNQINQTLESMARAIFKEWFIDFGPVKAKAAGKKPFGMDDETAALFPDSFEESELGLIPKGWGCTYLKKICQFEYGKALKEENRIHGDIDVWGSNSVIGCHNVSFIAAPGIVVGRKGNAGAINWAFKDFWPIDTAFYIVPQNGYSLEFIFQSLKLIDFKSLNSDSAVPGLNRELALSSKIIIPKSLDIIQKFSEINRSIYCLVKNNLIETETLTKIRDMLLPRLISGEISKLKGTNQNNFLFNENKIKKIDPAYLNHKDSEFKSDIKDYLENAYQELLPYLGDKNIEKKVQEDFHAMAWQLYLGKVLLDKHIPLIKANSNGPDYNISGGTIIEAVISKRGENAKNKPFALEDIVPLTNEYGVKFYTHSGATTDEKIILRITSSIEDKANQYKKWLNDKVINSNQPFIIAINTGLIYLSNEKTPLSYGEKICFGMGDLVISVPISRTKEEVKNSNLSYNIQQKSAALKYNKNNETISIPLGLFLNEEYSFISGIIISGSYMGNVLHDPGCDLEIIINPYARNQLNEDQFSSLNISKLIIDNANNQMYIQRAKRVKENNESYH